MSAHGVLSKTFIFVLTVSFSLIFVIVINWHTILGDNGLRYVNNVERPLELYKKVKPEISFETQSTYLNSKYEQLPQRSERTQNHDPEPVTKVKLLRQLALEKNMRKNVEQFIDQLQIELEKYGTKEDPLKSLNINKNLGEIIKTNQSVPILLVSTWRSGSTFIGQLLGSHPGAWFWSEPGHFLELGKPRLSVDKITDDEIIPVVQNSLKCAHGEQFMIHNGRAMFAYFENVKYWNICMKKLHLGKAMCTSKAFVDTICALFPIRVAKTVRMRLRAVKVLLEDPDLKQNLKVIYLIRDPRAVMRSRRKVGFCVRPYCTDPKILCQNHVKDYLIAKEIAYKYPSKFRILRYEDFALDPYHVTDQLLEFLKLPPSIHVDRFLERRTELSRDHDTHSKDDVSFPKTKAFAWMQSMNKTEVIKIQEVCDEALHAFGYKPIDYINIGNIVHNDFDIHL